MPIRRADHSAALLALERLNPGVRVGTQAGQAALSFRQPAGKAASASRTQKLAPIGSRWSLKS